MTDAQRIRESIARYLDAQAEKRRATGNRRLLRVMAANVRAGLDEDANDG